MIRRRGTGSRRRFAAARPILPRRTEYRGRSWRRQQFPV